MKTRLLKKFRYFYRYYYNSRTNKWMILSNDKWGFNLPAALSLSDTHAAILLAIEQFKGYKFTAKLQSRNALKNQKPAVPYQTDKSAFLVYDPILTGED